MADTLKKFFTNKHFRIPNYQRDYSWGAGNVDDLIDDLIEAIETSTRHYIGTFILSEVGQEGYFNVVDGQQRLTTLILLINAAVDHFGSERDEIIYKDAFIQSERDWRLTLLNDNNQFFRELVSGDKPNPSTRGQRLMADASQHIHHRIGELRNRLEIADQLLDAVQRLEVMEFIESDDGKAIRMFQTVNDRGKPMTNMEKAKSLLVYYSNRFLRGDLDDKINDFFGDVFHMYDDIKSAGDEYGVDVIKRANFSEDSVMRYHFLAYADDYYDYAATESYVLEGYLKQSLKKLRNQHPEQLRQFIEDYITNLRDFVGAFADLLKISTFNTRLYKLFSVLGISARLYPLMIRLQQRGLLDENPELLNCLEVVDVRVYKVRGTDPRKDISVLARDSKYLSSLEVKKKVSQFVDEFMSDSEFARRLSAEIYPNDSLKHIFFEYSEDQRGERYSLTELRTRNEMQPTIEHVFPRERAFDYPDSGFENNEDFELNVNKLGNLTLPEKGLNSAAHNMTPAQKILQGIYEKSKFEDPVNLSAKIKNRGEGFTKAEVERRTEVIANFCLERWPSINV